MAIKYHISCLKKDTNPYNMYLAEMGWDNFNKICDNWFYFCY